MSHLLRNYNTYIYSFDVYITIFVQEVVLNSLTSTSLNKLSLVYSLLFIILLN